MTDRREVIALISKALDEVLDQPVGELTEATGLLSDLGLNSASVLELLMVVEDAAGISVDPEDLTIDHLRTVRSFADFVEAAVRRGAEGEK
jgi:acyl carrier protein